MIQEIRAGRHLLWLTWENQVRNRSLSTRMDAQLVEIIEPGGRLKRYFRSMIRTSYYLWQWRGSTVIVQNPSLALSLQSVLLKPFLRYRLLVDAHNAGIYPAEAKNPLLMTVANFIIRSATAVIVSNKGLARRVAQVGGRPIVIPDPLPKLHGNDSSILSRVPSATHYALFICTWASDEPYLEVFAAAEKLPDVLFLTTGRSKGRENGYGKPLPKNVVLTGYLPEDEYHTLLGEVDVVIDLTTRDDCLVCGAYESVAAMKPFVLSSTTALREYFRKGGVHVENTASSISEGVRRIINDQAKYKHEVTAFKDVLEQEWHSAFDVAMREIIA